MGLLAVLVGVAVVGVPGVDDFLRVKIDGIGQCKRKGSAKRHGHGTW